MKDTEKNKVLSQELKAQKFLLWQHQNRKKSTIKL